MGGTAPDPAATIPYLHVSGEDFTRPFLWSPDRPMDRGFLQFGYKKEKVNLSSIRYATEEFMKGYIAGTMDTWAFLEQKEIELDKLSRAFRAWQSCQLKNDGVRSKATTGAATVDEAYQRTTEWLAKAAKSKPLSSDEVYPMELILYAAWLMSEADPSAPQPISSCVASGIKALDKKEEAERKKSKG